MLALARSATGSKCDGFLNTRARQVQMIVLQPVIPSTTLVSEAETRLGQGDGDRVRVSGSDDEWDCVADIAEALHARGRVAHADGVDDGDPG